MLRLNLYEVAEKLVLQVISSSVVSFYSKGFSFYFLSTAVDSFSLFFFSFQIKARTHSPRPSDSRFRWFAFLRNYVPLFPPSFVFVLRSRVSASLPLTIIEENLYDRQVNDREIGGDWHDAPAILRRQEGFVSVAEIGFYYRARSALRRQEIRDL